MSANVFSPPAQALTDNFLADKGQPPPPHLENMSAKNVSFFGTAPLIASNDFLFFRSEVNCPNILLFSQLKLINLFYYFITYSSFVFQEVFERGGLLCCALYDG